MKIGIYFHTLKTTTPSTIRFQNAMMDGLIRKSDGRYTFFVLSWKMPDGLKDSAHIKYVKLQPNGRFWRIEAFFKKCVALVGLRLGRLLKCGEGQVIDTLRVWRRCDPRYYAQLKELGIRLIWHPTSAELMTWLPAIRTVWDINHRIHPEYPEYAYSRGRLERFEELEECWESVRKATYLIVGTEEGKRQLVSCFGVYAPRVRVIPFPTPLLPETSDLPAPELGFKEPYLIYPARFWPHKNHVVAVAALKVLQDKWNLRLNFVFTSGDAGNLDHVMNYAESLGVRDQIKYLGQVELPELTMLYRHALALAYVSATGPDNLPPLEAMSLGCPAIVADVPGAREQYGDACLFFPPMDESALAEQIKLLLEDRSLRETLIAKGLVRAKQWTVEDYAGKVIELFDEFALVARSWASSTAVFD